MIMFYERMDGEIEEIVVPLCKDCAWFSGEDSEQGCDFILCKSPDKAIEIDKDLPIDSKKTEWLQNGDISIVFSECEECDLYKEK